MEIKVKSYSGKDVQAVVGWTPQFLDLILNEFGETGTFTPEGVNEHLEKETNFYENNFTLNENILALKIYRLFLRGFFERVLMINNRNLKGRKSYFVYSFSKKSKDLINNYGTFSIALNYVKGGNNNGR